MKPDLTPDEMRGLYRRLLYARWLYEKGVGDAGREDELAHMVAVMHFHNAVEIVLENILACYKLATPAGTRDHR